MIVVYGARGKIGCLVVSDLKNLGHEVASVDLGLEEVFTPTEHDTAIWCATSPPPHNRLASFSGDLQAFLAVLQQPYGRVIFTSSFGIENGNGVYAINAYAAGKIASEAFLKAWSEENALRSGVSIRMGGYGPLTDVTMPWAMTEAQVVACYRSALSRSNGFHIIRPLHQDWISG
ncbi:MULTISPECIES: NAD(P)-dependent oxidoreductase [Rhizobium/Agrobacterium group]|uniref:NAD(P)-dependent oxidoreductase n=1 Tax=Rhizobium/Agrobacterium group TaxID=227290 RepID=UPI00157221FF|nr:MULTISPECIES: NAD(P)-dependent oxidoreductase [Rhizobium/Agrobacterium group]MCF1446617.1 NAD(P)-dependent oxidoreductase [Allorhizobium ampelinum]NSZ53463.1 NAD(P)-dependent oxidoreductase [Agrobacterium vitis]NTA32222.1 NAD(P)-dependent oxidoreductase [Agrobacterium vitis]